MNAHVQTRRGFTLVEVVITLSIIVLLIGLATAAMQSFWHQRELEVPMARLKEYAKRARNAAILEQRPYVVEITPQGVALLSLAGQVPEGALASLEGVQRGVVDRFSWDAEVVMRVRRWNQPEFSELPRHSWVFERSGLCEPLTARVQSEFGFIEMTFNPLDAHVEHEVSEIR